MESLSITFLPIWMADGPRHMAADEVMLQTAAEGRAAFRMYRWSEPTVSLGYFQSHETRDKVLRQLPFVRRPTGGLTLVHHHEVTYSLALPVQHARQPARNWLEQIHRVIGIALANLGVSTEQAQEDKPPAENTPLCFHHITCGDLTISGTKVVGSSQRRQRGALLQHGAILLATSPFTPSLFGIKQITGRAISQEDMIVSLSEEMIKFFRFRVAAAIWSRERKEMLEVAEMKYRSQDWNEKR